MNKPITVLRNEFIDIICTIINNSGLPAFVMIDVLERVMAQLNAIAQTELQRDMDLYKKAMEEEEKAGQQP